MAKKAGGFTLIELMIVVAIIGIIAAIAYPSYTSQVMKSERADARDGLLTTAQLFERCFTEFNSYLNGACPALPVNSPEGYYSIDEDPGKPLTAMSYNLMATPNAGTAVAGDNDCTSFSLDSKGAKSFTGTGTQCW